jgi:ParB/RepB/Spo0J family partition protein
MIEEIEETETTHPADLKARSEVKWVSLNRVIPNPMNPRKDNGIKTDEMQDIILKRGWEEPLTVYEQGKLYVLLAGHRRLYAAKRAGIKKVPIFIVVKPNNDQEEIERIASLQAGRVDWTPFEWAKFTFDRWIAWGQPSIQSFSKQINIGSGSVKQYINVLSYFPHDEIFTRLQTKELTISSLDALSRWIKSLKKNKPDLIDAMGENLIRKTMLEKISRKKLNRDDLKNVEYTELATEEDILDFLTDEDASLSSRLGYLGLKRNYRDFNGHLISIGLMEKRIPEIKPDTVRQKEQALKALEELNDLVQRRIAELKE